jgi:AcrR family transcriptional regulator
MTSQGRRFRSDSLRKRDAVVDALLDLYREGELSPSAGHVAERAGVSERSLFRYFDSLDDLVGVAIAHQYARLSPVLPLVVEAGTSLTDRIRLLVDHRIVLFETIGLVGVATRAHEPHHPAITAGLTRLRSMLRSQLRELFAAELSQLSRSDARNLIATLDVLCSYEGFRLLTADQGLSRRQVRTVLVATIERLCAAITSG